MKRYLAGVFGLVLCLGLVGCGGTPPKPAEPTADPTATVEPTAAMPEATPAATGTTKMTVPAKEVGETPAVPPTDEPKLTAKAKPSKLFKLLSAPAFEALDSGKNAVQGAAGIPPDNALPLPE